MEFLLLVHKNGTTGEWHYAGYPRGATLIASGEFQVKANRGKTTRHLSGTRQQGVYAATTSKASVKNEVLITPLSMNAC
ncbi:hypothetical protein [Stenotrophomonas cyclobalanopsidis]|uniref:hypothetical protein n=1 Tax=Stenotrophomonas cyclobalanopsidis TaxID=2771362 RepID=UPI0028A70D84|nr:hypothetical protein [Stenotrophomonas cyclobalanopsidis]